MVELASQNQLSQETQQYINTIERSAKGLLSLLDDIIELSDDGNGENSKVQQFGLTELLEDIKESTAGTRLARNSALTVEFSQEISEWYRGPRGRIRQIITQLINYAIRQAESPETLLRISFHSAGPEDELMKFHLQASVRSDLFEQLSPFQDPRILICRRILLEIGHDLKAEIDSEKGLLHLTFSVKAEQLNMPWAQPLLPTPVVAIAATDPLARIIVMRRLQGCGFQVETASSLEDAQKILDFHLADGVSGQRGLTLIDFQLIKAVAPHAPVLIPEQIFSASLRHPVIVFDIPPLNLMALSTELENMSSFQNRDDVGLVMFPSRGEQLIPELLRILQIDREQLRSPYSDTQERVEEPDLELLMGMKVLVVEDDRINQKILIDILKRFGIKSVVATTGAAALKAVERFRFEAIFMDINLPDSDGYTLTQQIRRKEGYAFTPVIALTASTRNRQKCFDAGMDQFLSKPYSENQLFAALHRVKEGG